MLLVSDCYGPRPCLLLLYGIWGVHSCVCLVVVAFSGIGAGEQRRGENAHTPNPLHDAHFFVVNSAEPYIHSDTAGFEGAGGE